MAQQISDLMPFWKDLSYKEKFDIVKEIRYNKYELKPVLSKKNPTKKKSSKKKASSKKKQASNKKVADMLKSLSPEQRKKILEALTNG